MFFYAPNKLNTINKVYYTGYYLIMYFLLTFCKSIIFHIRHL